VAGLLLVALVGALAVALRPHPSPWVIARTAVGRTPSAMAVDERSGHLFVTNSADNTVSMLDARTGRRLRTSAVGDDPDQLRVNPRTERLFVLNAGAGSVSVIDATSGALLRTLTPPAAPVSAVGRPGSALFVFDNSDDAAAGVGPGLDAPGRMVLVLDAPSGTRVQGLTVPAHGWEPALDPATGQLLVATPADGRLGRFAVVAGRHLRAIPVGTAPVAVAVDVRTGRTFVVNSGQSPLAGDLGGSVSVLDSHSGRVLRTVGVGRDPALVAVDGAAGAGRARVGRPGQCRGGRHGQRQWRHRHPRCPHGDGAGDGGRGGGGAGGAVAGGASPADRGGRAPRPRRRPGSPAGAAAPRGPGGPREPHR
jgi:hypothetical protein